MDNKLKPCPFCGGEAILAENANSEELLVECCNCYAHTGLYCSEQEAIDAWNRRVSPPFTLDELDAIRRNVRDWRTERELSKIEQSIIDKCDVVLKGGCVE